MKREGIKPVQHGFDKQTHGLGRVSDKCNPTGLKLEDSKHMATPKREQIRLDSCIGDCRSTTTFILQQFNRRVKDLFSPIIILNYT